MGMIPIVASTGLKAEALSPGCDGWPGEKGLAWEQFLESTPRGQYQQSLRWARVKQGEGWDFRLSTWGPTGQIEGGFLLLIKATRLGRVGFVNKGPVLAQETPDSVRDALGRVMESARAHRLRALILQPPDRSSIRSEDLWRSGFCRSPVPGIIDATVIASLEGGRNGIWGRLGRTARREARRAIERGVEIVEGTRENLPRFFDLMCQTCRRQGVAPNPARVDALYRRWEAFGSDIKLLFAKVHGELVAGLLLLRFGRTCTFEKKGWNEQASEAHPNTLLNVEAMIRAAEWGCEFVDFVAMDRGLAERMLKGEDVEQEVARTRHAFNLRLGAKPVLLTPAHVGMPHSWQRPWVDWILGRRSLARYLGRFLTG